MDDAGTGRPVNVVTQERVNRIYGDVMAELQKDKYRQYI